MVPSRLFQLIGDLGDAAGIRFPNLFRLPFLLEVVVCVPSLVCGLQTAFIEGCF